MDRNLDGVYFRVKRDGEYRNVCFSDLTSDERDAVLKDRPVEWLRSLCCVLADTIKEIGDIFDLAGRY